MWGTLQTQLRAVVEQELKALGVDPQIEEG